MGRTTTPTLSPHELIIQAHQAALADRDVHLAAIEDLRADLDHALAKLADCDRLVEQLATILGTPTDPGPPAGRAHTSVGGEVRPEDGQATPRRDRRKPATTVKNWFAQARKAGLVTPRPTIPPTTPNDSPSLEEVAATVREAYEAGRRPLQTVIDRYDCTRDQARTWVDAARAAGHLPPRDQPQVPGELPPDRASPRHFSTVS